MGKQAKKDIVGPTREQKKRGRFELQEIVDKGDRGSIKIGKAYRREPYFEELARREATGIGGDELRALRYYRNAYEAAARSEVRSNLNRDMPGGSSEGPLLAQLYATSDVVHLERGIGAVVHTLRAVAIEDKSYAEVAMDRWGSRQQHWIDVNKAGAEMHRTKIVPKSGKHPGLIREEFLLAVRRLADRVKPYLRTGD